MAVGDLARPVQDTQPQSVGSKLLAGKKALITGGSRGIGRATVLALAKAGADVAVNFQSNAQAAEAVCDEASELDVVARAFQADVSSEEQTKRMIDELYDQMGPIDILVNNAGITRDKTFLKTTRTMWDEVLGVNLTGTFNVTRAVLPAMVEAGWGRVINISSIVGQIGNFGQLNYSVTKDGMIAFTLSLAREVARKGVTVNAVAPGFIETDMTKDLPETTITAVNAMTPVGRFGKPEEVAAAIAFLASPKAGYVTGQVLAVNGGMYA